MESPPTHPLPLDGTATPSGRPRRRWLLGAAILGAAALIAGGDADVFGRGGHSGSPAGRHG